MIHLDQRWASGLSRHAEADRLFAGVAVLRRPDLQGMVSAWGELIFADETAELLRSRFRGLLEVLGDVTPEHRQVGEAEPELRQMLSPVLERLRDDESNPSLDELAAMVGMGRYQLVRAVKRATGLTPLAWRQNARIGRARRMLRDGLPIAETAVALGFTDQSHFHRVFRAHVAASPGTYRA